MATPTELTLAGTLIRVADGGVLARESVAGSADSIAVLVNRLTAALLIRDAGEAGDRSTGLSAAPLEALQDYLAGRKAARRGDVFNAIDLYARAFKRDTTFVDAAFGMLATNAWNGTVYSTAGYTVIPFLGRNLQRLSARDRSLFLSLPIIGPNYPGPSTHAEIIAQAERAANDAPDSPEHWLLLGQVLSHYGAAASRGDWPKRSADALDRAIALDSSFTPAVSERLFTALLARDHDAIVKFAKLLESRVAAGFSDDMLLWAAARALGDSATAMRWRDRKAGMSATDYLQKLTKIPLHSAALALPLGDARYAAAILGRDATTDNERTGAVLADMAVRFAEGGDMPAQHDIGPVWGAGWATSLIQQGLIDRGYRVLAATTLARENAGDYRLASDGRSVRWPPIQLCFGELYRVSGGDTTTARQSIGKLRAFAGGSPPAGAEADWPSLEFRVCPLLLEVMLEHAPPRGQRWPRLDELDSVMRTGPRWFSGTVIVSPSAFANYTIARLRESQGDLADALAAIRRREVDYFPTYLWSLPAFLRQEGRLAALTGDVPGALKAYDQYLAMRTDPAVALRPQRDSVVSERAALHSSPSRP